MRSRFDHAYGISKRKDFTSIFGNPRLPYDPDRFLDHSPSEDFAPNITVWYGKTHPCEDFAETFAFWLASKQVKKQGMQISAILQRKILFVQKMHSLYATTPIIHNNQNNLGHYRRIKKTVGEMLKKIAISETHTRCYSKANLQRY
jgi:hypothetical protein